MRGVVPAASMEPPDRLDELQADSYFYHEVKRGETLFSIAKRYKASVKTLRELKDLPVNAGVKPGDRLIVGKK